MQSPHMEWVVHFHWVAPKGSTKTNMQDHSVKQEHIPKKPFLITRYIGRQIGIHEDIGFPAPEDNKKEPEIRRDIEVGQKTPNR